MTAASLWDRLARLLHREHHAILLGHRDLMTLPLDERVEQVMEEAVEFATASPSPSVEEFLAEVAAS